MTRVTSFGVFPLLLAVFHTDWRLIVEFSCHLTFIYNLATLYRMSFQAYVKAKLGTSCCSRCSVVVAAARLGLELLLYKNTFSRRTAELLKGWGIQSANTALLKNDFSVLLQSQWPSQQCKKTPQKIPLGRGVATVKNPLTWFFNDW